MVNLVTTPFTELSAYSKYFAKYFQNGKQWHYLVFSINIKYVITRKVWKKYLNKQLNYVNITV